MSTIYEMPVHIHNAGDYQQSEDKHWQANKEIGISVYGSRNVN